MSRYRLLKLGYKIKERGLEKKVLRKRILWWRKGYPGSYHYKCEGRAHGYVYEGVGATLDQALEDFDTWAIQIGSPENRNYLKHLKRQRTMCVEALVGCDQQQRRTRIFKHLKETVGMYDRSIEAWEKKGLHK